MTVERGDGWELRLADCLDPEHGLASLESCDHVLTDPPYEAEAHTKARRFDKQHIAIDYEIDFAPITTETREAVAHHIARACTGWALAFCQVEAVAEWRRVMEAAGMQWRRGMAWVKPDGTPQLTGDRPAQGFECMALSWCRKGRSAWNGGGKRGVYTAMVNNFGRLTDGRPHPTMKPMDLMEAIVRDFTCEGDLICDPFAGSGTTGVAALRLGRRFIGWERDPKYFAIAVKRLRAAREQLRMFDERTTP